MADLNRRNFLMGTGAMALTSAFATRAFGQPLFHPDRVAKELMSAPAEAWNRDAVNALTPDQREAVIGQIKILQHNVEYKTKLRLLGAAEEAKGPSLDEKVQMALELVTDSIGAYKDNMFTSLTRARRDAADASALSSLYPESRYLAQQAYAKSQAAENMAINVWRTVPQVDANLQEQVDNTVQNVIKAEVMRDAYHDPVMVFAPESARAIPGLIRNREMDPVEGKTQALNDLTAWYSRATDILSGKTPMPVPVQAPSFAVP